MLAGTIGTAPATEWAGPRCCRYPATRNGSGTGRDLPGAGPDVTYRLRVNPIACTAHGMCAELLPEHGAAAGGNHRSAAAQLMLASLRSWPFSQLMLASADQATMMLLGQPLG